eukprot:24235-Pelagomonas_calceolata.AAC.1
MTPVGTPVGFVLDKEGIPIISLANDSIELRNIATNPRCSLKVQPAAYPARALASVTLMGKLGEPLPSVEGNQGPSNIAAYPLQVDKCLCVRVLVYVCCVRACVRERAPMSACAAEPRPGCQERKEKKNYVGREDSPYIN